MKIKLFMLMNQRGVSYRNYEKRGYSEVSCWINDSRKGTIWFAKNGPIAAIKHIKLTKDKISELRIVSKEIELPTVDDTIYKIEF